VHQRRIIRDAVAVRIASGMAAVFGLTGEPTIQEGFAPVGDSRVFRSREAPAEVKSLLEEGPICNIYGRRDHPAPKDGYPTSGFDSGVRRVLELAIEITAAGSWVVDDKLDELTDTVEGLLEDFNIPGLPSAEIRLHETQIDSTDEFDVPLGGALLTYEISYFRPYRTDTSPEDVPCGDGSILSVIINGRPAESFPGCDC
jgi:hypothetical protein